ncbi:hypothetical protein LTR08_007746 [Meristemomyces frigidus]|nr:hypothetical protein LTR08_007746 [Meristemomyces frigidus]
MDPPEGPVFDVRRTVSSEVVNAYVDALLSGRTNTRPLLGRLGTTKEFLGRSNLKLVGGSWDAVILRFVDSQGHPASLPELKMLASLAPSFGHEVESANLHSLPDYVKDGSASFVGLCHRVLHAKIKDGNVNTAIRVFKLLQDFTDTNKRKSLEDFFGSIRSIQNKLMDSGEAEPFNSKYPTISYPAFDLQVPATTLGPFLDMLTDAGEYNLGNWLLYSDEVDGPLIPDGLYNDPAIAPALVKFATKTDDRALLSRLINIRAESNSVNATGPTLPSTVLRSFLETQFGLRRWDAAARILEHMSDSPDLTWDIHNLAALVRMMVLLRHGAKAGDNKCVHDLARAQETFTAMVQGPYYKSLDDPKSNSGQVTILLTVLSSVEEYWASFCISQQDLRGHRTFSLSAGSFNLVFESVLEAYGSVVARRLLGIFWPQALREALTGGRALAKGQAVTSRSLIRKSPLDRPDRHRTVVSLLGDKQTVFYGGLRPNLITIRMIFRKALDELRQHGAQSESQVGTSLEAVNTVSSPSSTVTADYKAETGPTLQVHFTAPYKMVIWSVRYLQAFGMANKYIRDELEGVPGLQAQLTRLLSGLEKDDWQAEDTAR